MKKLKSEFIRLSSAERLYGFERPVIGLTGGIATGKSTVTRLLEARGIRAVDADQLVKSIYATPEAIDFIRVEFPEAWQNGIDFKVLRDLFFKDLEIKKKVETFIYERLPLAFQKAAMGIKDQSFLLYDVPLLFEKKLNEKTDLSIVVYAPRSLQFDRLIERDGMSDNAAKRIIDQQMDIEDKKKKADIVINNSGTIQELATEVDKLLVKILD